MYELFFIYIIFLYIKHVKKVHIYIYIYIYIEREREREKKNYFTHCKSQVKYLVLSIEGFTV